MIISIVAFGLKSALCSALFGAYYVLALKNAPPASFNRFYLLAATLFSLLLPFARLEIFPPDAIPAPHIPLLALSGQGKGEALSATASSGSFSWPDVLYTGYLAVALILLSGLAVKTASLYFIRGKAERISGEGYVLVRTDDPRAPFSFMNRLFWPAQLRQDSPESRSILRHELAHIRQYHSLDKVVMQLLLAVGWINPVNWLFRRELWLQHEFLADRQAFRPGDSEAFARMLLCGACNCYPGSIINPFFQSPVRRRLAMVEQQARKCRYIWRGLLSIPVLLVVMILLSAARQPSPSAAPAPQKIVLVLDAGHGGTDAGGKSIYGFQEKDITLALCRQLNTLSGDYNIEIVNTREGDLARTLPERLQTSNHIDHAIFLSIHVRKNAATGTRDTSFEFGLNPKNGYYDQSMLLASAIANRLKSQHLPVKVVDKSSAYVLRENSHPALLVECGDLDNADDMALLQDKSRTETLCRNLLSGIVDYQARLHTTH